MDCGSGWVFEGAPMEIRTPALALKGLRPGPLDDGGVLSGRDCNTAFSTGQAIGRLFVEPLIFQG